jgi:hypothetical protein
MAFATVLFSACKHKNVISVVNRGCGAGAYTSDEIRPSLRPIEPDGGRVTEAPMRWVSNAVRRDQIDHGYSPKALSLKMTS